MPLATYHFYAPEDEGKPEKWMSFPIFTHRHVAVCVEASRTMREPFFIEWHAKD